MRVGLLLTSYYLCARMRVDGKTMNKARDTYKIGRQGGAHRVSLCSHYLREMGEFLGHEFKEVRQSPIRNERGETVGILIQPVDTSPGVIREPQAVYQLVKEVLDGTPAKRTPPK